MDKSAVNKCLTLFLSVDYFDYSTDFMPSISVFMTRFMLACIPNDRKKKMWNLRDSICLQSVDSVNRYFILN